MCDHRLRPRLRMPVFARLPRIFQVAARGLTFAVLLGTLAGCGHMGSTGSDRQCLARGMYVESVRSSDDGMLAVGTVVMNRLQSGRYPRTVCGVVGQPNQFAPG